MQIKTPFQEPVQFAEEGYTHTYSHDPKVYEAGEQQGVKKLKSLHGKKVKLLTGHAGDELQHVEFEGGHKDFVAHHELEKGVKHSYQQQKASQHAEALVDLGPLGRGGPAVAAPCSPAVQFREAPVKEEVEQFSEAKKFRIVKTRYRHDGNHSISHIEDTLPELEKHHSYTLSTGHSYQNEKGRHKIKTTGHKSIESLTQHLNKATDNAAANGSSNTSYHWEPAGGHHG